ncbi:MAG: hypothetical protein DMC62_06830 [Verrucomicrobia bacterium]|nr:MAG: hypothetical protein DMC62_06830 [Verrucomicrobiota bacterium]
MVMAPIAAPITAAPIATAPVATAPVAAIPVTICSRFAAAECRPASGERVSPSRWHRVDMPATMAAALIRAYCGCSQRNRGEET